MFPKENSEGFIEYKLKLHNINEELKLRCINCNKECNSRQSLYYHKKVCNTNTNLVTKEELEKFKNEIIMQRTINNNNSNNNNTINDNRKQIIINYTPGTEPLDHLSVKEQKQIMDKGLNSLLNLIKSTNFDKDKPEYHSYCVTALNDKHASMIDTNTIIKYAKHILLLLQCL